MSKPGSESNAWSSRDIAAVLTGAGAMVASGARQLNLEGRHIINPKTAAGLVLAVSQLLNLPSCGINTENPTLSPTPESNLKNINGLNIDVVDPFNNLKPDQQRELALVNGLFIQADQSSNLTFPKTETDLDNPLKKGSLTEALSVALNKPIESIDVNKVNPAFLPKIIKFGNEGELIIQPVVYTNDDGQEQIVMFGSGNNGTDWGLVGLTDQPFDVFSSPGNGVVVQGISQMFTAFSRESTNFTGLLVMGGENGAVFSQALYFKVDSNNGKLELVLRNEDGTLSGPAEENIPLSPQKGGLLNVTYIDNPVVPPTPELIPTETPTLIPVPMIEVGGLTVPDPRFSNPEFFNLTSPDSPIVQFANAFGVKPEEVGDLTPQLLTGLDGKQFVVLTTGDLTATANFDETNTPLLIAEQKDGVWGWRDVDTGNLSRLSNVPFGLGNIMEGKYYYYQFTPEEKNAQIELSSVYSFGDVFQASAILWKGEGKYDWNRPDTFIGLLKNKGRIRGGHLVWDKDAFPEWFNNLKNEAVKNPDAYRERFISILSNYIKEAVSRYKNNVHEWSVLNEIVGPDGNLDQNNFWVKIIGPDLPRIAIETVRSTDPAARIVINEFGAEFSGPKSDGYYRLIKQLKEQGLLNDNDIVGFQFHISAKDPKFKDTSSAKEEIKRNLRRFIDLEVKVAITELDIMELWSNDPQSLIKQAEMYKSVVEACFELNLDYGKLVCDSIVVWGLNDDSTWLHYITDKPGYPLLFDNEGKPKPSYYAMLGSYFKYISTLTK